MMFSSVKAILLYFRKVLLGYLLGQASNAVNKYVYPAGLVFDNSVETLDAASEATTGPKRDPRGRVLTGTPYASQSYLYKAKQGA